jgi:proline dehydrogenase
MRIDWRFAYGLLPNHGGAVEPVYDGIEFGAHHEHRRMNLLRNTFIKASQNEWLRRQAPRFAFVRRTAGRFLPGEDLDSALAAARGLAANGISTLLTYLGENISDRDEAAAVAERYLDTVKQIHAAGLPSEISVKLTQLGLDVDVETCFANLTKLLDHSDSVSDPRGHTVWIDMEHSPYVDVTIEVFRRARAAFRNVGLCLQAYLYRTETDIEKLLPLGPSIRLVKGAYSEPPEIAFARKRDVDENFFRLTKRLLSPGARSTGARAVIATHDRNLITRITVWAGTHGTAKPELEFAMLYGIQRSEQIRLARAGYRSCVLVSYGAYWFPWFMRRLAERPANALFLARNLFSS